jgi:hypothetical protein
VDIALPVNLKKIWGKLFQLILRRQISQTYFNICLYNKSTIFKLIIIFLTKFQVIVFYNRKNKYLKNDWMD